MEISNINTNKRIHIMNPHDLFLINTLYTIISLFTCVARFQFFNKNLEFVDLIKYKKIKFTFDSF